MGDGAGKDSEANVPKLIDLSRHTKPQLKTIAGLRGLDKTSSVYVLRKRLEDAEKAQYAKAMKAHEQAIGQEIADDVVDGSASEQQIYEFSSCSEHRSVIKETISYL